MSSCDGFDTYAGRKWIYPINMPIRNYQKTAVEKALFKNTMIVLPTGFGKTFIAAVVMYNFYLWYPEGKLIFVAPTRPLVNQQIDECRKVSGIPGSDCIELTGSILREKRVDHWKLKRVFFATPQVIENDLENDILPATQVRCIVIDEAHRAQGGYAYVNIVRKLNDLNRNRFRVLALSATPGTDIERVRQVMLNLYIGEVMFRTEDSIDLAQYRNQKSSKAWIAEFNPLQQKFVNMFIKICDPTFKELYKAGLTYGSDSVDRVHRYTILKAMDKIREHDVRMSRGITAGKLKFLCSVAMAMSQKFELLSLYGIRVFYSTFMRAYNESRSALRTALASSVDLDMMLSDMRKLFGDDIEPDISKPGKMDFLKGHPKLAILQSLLTNHFSTTKNETTRAIVFTKYRESVYDIVQTLRAFDPILKPCAFVGQGNRADNLGQNKGMSQKEQIKIISDFKSGLYNILVATCVAEEGLDIGEVDIIICYDTSSSPISNTQRRGRTGRKRTGNVHTLVAKGFEEKKLAKAGSSRRQVESELFNRETYMKFAYKDSPRMIPDNIEPAFFAMHISPVEDVIEEPVRKRKRQKKSPVPGSAGKKRKSKAIGDYFGENKTNESDENGKKERQEEDQDDEPTFVLAKDLNARTNSEEKTLRLACDWDSDEHDEGLDELLQSATPEPMSSGEKRTDASSTQGLACDWDSDWDSD